MENSIEAAVRNFPVSGYPGMRLSDERVAVLAQYNEILENGQRPTALQFRRFMENFWYLGPLDAMVQSLGRDNKKRLLSCAALCHVASSGLGRDYLNARGDLRLADDDSAALLSAILHDTLRRMLANAEIGDRCMIVMTLPTLDLRISPGAACFGDGANALSVSDAKLLLVEMQADGTTLLEKFAAEMQNAGASISDMAVWKAWYALIRKCIDDKTVGSLHGSPIIHSALGDALRGLVRRMSGDLYRDPEPFSVHEAMKYCVDAYCAASDWRGCGQAYLDLASHHKANGEYDLASNCYRSANIKLVHAIKALWTERRAEAMKCYELAIDACRRDDNAAAEREVTQLVETLRQSDAATFTENLRARVEQVGAELEAIRGELNLAGRSDAQFSWDMFGAFDAFDAFAALGALDTSGTSGPARGTGTVEHNVSTMSARHTALPVPATQPATESDNAVDLQRRTRELPHLALSEHAPERAPTGDTQ